MTPFEADLGYTPRMPMDVMVPAAGKPRPGGGTQAVTFATRMADIVQELVHNLKTAQEAYMREANKTRQPHNFQPGDKIMLNTRNLPLTYGNADTNAANARLSRALQQRYVGPYTLGRKFGENAFELVDIPDHLRVHRTFNVNLFKRYTIDETREQAPPPPIRVLRSGDAEYEVEAIRAWRLVGKSNLQFLMVWKGYPPEAATWEPLRNLTRYGCQELLTDFIQGTNDNALSALVPVKYRPPNYLPARRRRGRRKKYIGT